MEAMNKVQQFLKAMYNRSPNFPIFRFSIGQPVAKNNNQQKIILNNNEDFERIKKFNQNSKMMSDGFYLYIFCSRLMSLDRDIALLVKNLHLQYVLGDYLFKVIENPGPRPATILEQKNIREPKILKLFPSNGSLNYNLLDLKIDPEEDNAFLDEWLVFAAPTVLKLYLKEVPKLLIEDN